MKSMYLLFLLIICGQCGCIYANDIRTSDGLSLGVSGTGQIISLSMNGHELLYAQQSSGIYVKDFTNNRMELVNGKVTYCNDKVVVSGEAKSIGILVNTVWKSSASKIECYVSIQDITNSDRAIQVVPTFFLNGANWRWAGDIKEAVEISPGKEGETCDVIPWPRKINIFPFSCVIDPSGKNALSLCTRMDYPRIYRNCIKQGDQFATVKTEIDLGLSTDTEKFPSKSDCYFCLQSVDAKLGFRGAAAKYYKTFPEFFSSRARKIGTWTLWAPKDIFAWWEFGFAYNQMQMNPNGDKRADSLISDEKYGLLSVAYSEPQAYWAGYGKLGQKLDTDFRLSQNVLEAPFYSDVSLPEYIIDDAVVPGISRSRISRAILNSAITGVDGNWQHRYWSDSYGRGKAGWTMILLNPDFDLPSPNRGQVSWGHEYLGVDALAKSLNVRLDGLYIDSVQGFAGMDVENYRREHWKYADIPLTFSYETKKPIQLHGFAMYEYLAFLRERCNQREWIMLGNGWIPHYMYTAHFFDVLGATENNILRMGEYWAQALRVTGGRKPISFLDYRLIQESELTDQQLLDSFNLMLLYDLMPGTANWDTATPVGIERARKYMREYIPEFIMLGEAGWSPVTGATGNNLKIERYGAYLERNLSFAIMNSNKSKIDNAAVIIDCNYLNITDNNSIYAIKLPNYEIIALNTRTTSFEIGKLEAGNTIVLRVGKKEQLESFKRERCGLYVSYLTNLLASDPNSLLNKIINIDEIRKDFSSSVFGSNVTIKELLNKVAELEDSKSKSAAIFYIDKIKSVCEAFEKMAPGQR